MRQYLGLFFIGLIALSSVASLNQDIQYLRELKQTEFGKTLVESIQIELRSGSSADAVDRILALLGSLNNQIDQERKADRAKYTSWKRATQGRVAGLKARVAKLSAAIKSDYALIKLNNAVISRSRAALAVQQKALAQDQRNLAANVRTQKETTAVYQDTFTKLSAQITAIAYAKSLLVRMVKGSFVETSAEEFVQLQGSLSNMQFQHPKFQGFMAVCAELLSEVSRVHSVKKANRVIQLLSLLYSQLVKQAADLTTVYKRRIGDLQLAEERLHVSINLHNAEIAGLETTIAQKQESNVAARQRVRDNKQRRSEARAEIADLVKQLAHERAAHAKRQALRNSQTAIVNLVIKIFKTRITNEVRASIASL